jgi:hypothetical protein
MENTYLVVLLCNYVQVYGVIEIMHNEFTSFESSLN